MRKPIHNYMEFTDLKDMLKKSGEIYGDNQHMYLKLKKKVNSNKLHIKNLEMI